MKTIKVATVGLVLVITACAGQIKGIVLPYEGGQYQAVSVAGDKSSALKIADNDAMVTCKKIGKEEYVVISQEVLYIPPPEVNTGNSFIDTFGKIAAYNESQENTEDYEATTVFKCT